MKQEFITLYGKAIIEGDKLFIRSFYLPFSKTAFAQIGYELFYIIAFALQFLRDDKSRMYVGVLLWGFLLLSRLPNIYDVLIKRSYAARIPLQRICSISCTDDHFGLQTSVLLHLKNGRYRKLTFRKLENQYEPFIDAISKYLIQPQLA